VERGVAAAHVVARGAEQARERAHAGPGDADEVNAHPASSYLTARECNKVSGSFCCGSRRGGWGKGRAAPGVGCGVTRAASLVGAVILGALAACDERVECENTCDRQYDECVADERRSALECDLGYDDCLDRCGAIEPAGP
jgi:hypothetical protein